jgi:hypothetical protein
MFDKLFYNDNSFNLIRIKGLILNKLLQNTMKVEFRINNNEFGMIFTILVIGVKQVYNLLIDVLDVISNGIKDDTNLICD